MNLIRTTPRQSNEDWEPVSWELDSYYLCDDQACMLKRGSADPVEVSPNDIPCPSAHATSWASYAQHVVDTGEDPLGQFPVELTEANPVQWILQFEEVCGSLYLVSGRRLRGASITAHSLPMYVLRYLGATDAYARKHGRTRKIMLRVAPHPDSIDRSPKGNARMLIPNPVALTYEQTRRRRSELAEDFLISQRSQP